MACESNEHVKKIRFFWPPFRILSINVEADIDQNCKNNNSKNILRLSVS